MFVSAAEALYRLKALCMSSGAAARLSNWLETGRRLAVCALKQMKKCLKFILFSFNPTECVPYVPRHYPYRRSLDNDRCETTAHVKRLSYYQTTVPLLFQQCSESTPCFMRLQAPEESFARGSSPQRKNPKAFRSVCLKKKSGEECFKECWGGVSQCSLRLVCLIYTGAQWDHKFYFNVRFWLT